MQKMGRKKFIIIFSVICWGVPTGVITWIFNHNTSLQNIILKFALNMVGFLIAGVLFGYFLWDLGETSYYNYTQNQISKE